jgi:hypothetical protein
MPLMSAREIPSEKGQIILVVLNIPYEVIARCEFIDRHIVKGFQNDFFQTVAHYGMIINN